MRASPFLAWWLACCVGGSAGAQTQAQLATASAVTAWAGFFGGGTGRVEYTIPAATPITTPRTVTATLGSAINGTATLDPIRPLAARITAAGSASGQMNPAAGANGTVTWTLSGGGYGLLTIDMSASADVFPSVTTVAIAEVSAPGIFDRVQCYGGGPTDARRNTRLIRFPNTFVLRCTLSAAAPATAIRTTYASAMVFLDFVPLPLPPVRQQVFGGACGAPLAVTDTTTTTRHQVDFVITGAAPNGVVVLVFGVRRISVPIPGSPCSLLVEPATAVVLLADPGGRATLRVALPGPLQTIPIDVQAIALDTASRASAGVELTFADY